MCEYHSCLQVGGPASAGGLQTDTRDAEPTQRCDRWSSPCAFTTGCGLAPSAFQEKSNQHPSDRFMTSLVLPSRFSARRRHPEAELLCALNLNASCQVLTLSGLFQQVWARPATTESCIGAAYLPRPLPWAAGQARHRSMTPCTQPLLLPLGCLVSMTRAYPVSFSCFCLDVMV